MNPKLVECGVQFRFSGSYTHTQPANQPTNNSVNKLYVFLGVFVKCVAKGCYDVR